MRAIGSRSSDWTARCTLHAVLFAVLTSTACSFGGSEKSDPALFTWSGPLAAPGTVHLRNLNGEIVVRPSPDGNVHVTASAKWHKGNPKRDMNFQVVTSGSDLTICAIWGHGTCSATTYHSSSSGLNKLFGRSTDANVTLTVLVPARVLVDATTMNGDVNVTASAPVHARTVNGDVKVGTAVGPVDAVTVNGDVDIRMTTLMGTDPVRAESVTGDVNAWLPETLDASVSLSTVTGDVSADYGVAVATGKKLSATIGAGGRTVTIKSVTGSARLGRLAADGSIAKP